LKQDPLFVDFLLGLWVRDSEFIKLRELDGHRLSSIYIDKTKFYINSLLKAYESLKKLRLSQVTPRILDKWKLAVAQSEASLKGINHALNGIRVALRWAFTRGYISTDPTLSFKYISYKPQEKGALSSLEMSQVKSLEWPDIRQKAAIVLGFSCGLRRDEVRALRWRRAG
jgi:integrase